MWPEECKGAAEGAWCLGGRVWLTMVSNECVRRGRCCFQSAKGGEDVDEGDFVFVRGNEPERKVYSAHAVSPFV